MDQFGRDLTLFDRVEQVEARTIGILQAVFGVKYGYFLARNVNDFRETFISVGDGSRVPVVSYLGDDPLILRLKGGASHAVITASPSAVTTPGSVATHAFPLVARGLLQGVLLVCRKEDGAPISDQDAERIDSIVRQVGLCFELVR
jgi:hypothetical protein